MGAPKTTERIAQLESKLTELATQNALLMQLLQGKPAAVAPVNVNAMSVGIRNISDNTVGVVDRTVSPAKEYTLAPAQFAGDLGAAAVLPYTAWLAQRRTGLVTKGYIIRDDSVLGPVDAPAPPDKPEDYDPETFKNQVENPTEWIESKSEAEIRDGVAAFTADQPLRRLRACVDRKIAELRDGVYKDDPEPGQKALDYLPLKYRFVDELVTKRLMEDFSLMAGKWAGEMSLTNTPTK